MIRRIVLLVFLASVLFVLFISNSIAGECTAEDKFETIKNKNPQGQTRVTIRVFDQRTGKSVSFPVIQLGRPFFTRIGGYDCWICSDDPPATSWKFAQVIEEIPRDGTLVYKVPHDSYGNINSWLISQSDPTKICIRVYKPDCNNFYEGSATVYKGYNNFIKIIYDCSGVAQPPPPPKPPGPLPPGPKPSPQPPPPAPEGSTAKEWPDEGFGFWIFKIGMPVETVLQLTDKNEKRLWKQRNINPSDGEKNPRKIYSIGLDNFKFMEKDWFLNIDFKAGGIAEIVLENTTFCHPHCSTAGHRSYHQTLVQKISEKYGSPTFRDSKINDLGKDPNWGRTVDYNLKELWEGKPKTKGGNSYEVELTSVYRCNNCDGPSNPGRSYITHISFREVDPNKPKF